MSSMANMAGKEIAKTSTTAPAIRWSEPSLPEKLNAQVSSGESLFDLPVPSPQDAAALRVAIDAAAPPMPEKRQVEVMLTKLSVALPKAQTSAAEAGERLDLYWAGLKDIALPDLHFAFDALIKTARFFPTVAEVRAAAAPPMNMRAYRLSRMRMLLKRHDREWRPDPEALTDEERGEVRAFLAKPFAEPPPAQ